MRFIPRILIPSPLRSGGYLRSIVQLGSHLYRDYGWLRSRREGRCVNGVGEPIPWFTYPAIDYLLQLDYSGRSVFEWGAGNSTLFWAARAEKVISVESQREWLETVKARAPQNCELIFSPGDAEEYAGRINAYGRFDVVVIDGTGESRRPCSEIAPRHLKPGGFIVLDNSDLWPICAGRLRGAGLVQVDFTGFAPIYPDAHTTSLFLSRDFDFKPLGGVQPHRSIAQPAGPWPGQ